MTDNLTVHEKAYTIAILLATCDQFAGFEVLVVLLPST
jgi:hypothetical protein